MPVNDRYPSATTCCSPSKLPEAAAGESITKSRQSSEQKLKVCYIRPTKHTIKDDIFKTTNQDGYLNMSFIDEPDVNDSRGASASNELAADHN